MKRLKKKKVGKDPVKSEVTEEVEEFFLDCDDGLRMFTAVTGTMYHKYFGLREKVHNLFQVKASLEADIKSSTDMCRVLHEQLNALKKEIQTSQNRLEKLHHQQHLHRKKGRKLLIDTENTIFGEKLAPIGGSSAMVHSCYVDGWRCVSKEISLSLCTELSLRTFENEIDILEDLPYHPNICRYLFHFREAHRLSLFMTQYSCTLHDLVQQRKANFEYAELRKHCLDIARGLEFLHHHNIIHRDMKTENIFVMLNPNKEVHSLVIGDFDTSKNLNKAQPKTCIGTPQFMAPEVFASLDHKTYSLKADIYSYGMVLFEMTTLKLPYEGMSLSELNSMVQRGEIPTFPPFSSEIEAAYSPIVQLIYCCTAFDASKRPSAAQVVEGLSQPIISFGSVTQSSSINNENLTSGSSPTATSNLSTSPSGSFLSNSPTNTSPFLVTSASTPNLSTSPLRNVTQYSLEDTKFVNNVSVNPNFGNNHSIPKSSDDLHHSNVLTTGQNPDTNNIGNSTVTNNTEHNQKNVLSLSSHLQPPKPNLSAYAAAPAIGRYFKPRPGSARISTKQIALSFSDTTNMSPRNEYDLRYDQEDQEQMDSSSAPLAPKPVATNEIPAIILPTPSQEIPVPPPLPPLPTSPEFRVKRYTKIYLKARKSSNLPPPPSPPQNMRYERPLPGRKRGILDDYDGDEDTSEEEKEQSSNNQENKHEDTVEESAEADHDFSIENEHQEQETVQTQDQRDSDQLQSKKQHLEQQTEKRQPVQPLQLSQEHPQSHQPNSLEDSQLSAVERAKLADINVQSEPELTPRDMLCLMPRVSFRTARNKNNPGLPGLKSKLQDLMKDESVLPGLISPRNESTRARSATENVLKDRVFQVKRPSSVESIPLSKLVEKKAEEESRSRISIQRNRSADHVPNDIPRSLPRSRSPSPRARSPPPAGRHSVSTLEEESGKTKESKKSKTKSCISSKAFMDTPRKLLRNLSVTTKSAKS